MVETYRVWLEAEIKKQKFGITPKALYEPIRYIMRFKGKRVRPLLVLLAYSLYKNDPKKIIPLAMAIEVLHNFTLLHDDVMDQAPIRRGKRTVHKRWGVNTAILSGDAMLTKVYNIFLNTPSPMMKEGLQKLNACLISICEGQQQDMSFEDLSYISTASYINMIKKKTATLLGFSLEFGALLAGAPKKERKQLKDIGINIGIGFQLIDDLLDTYANKKKFGKQIGGDILVNKKTFLWVTALKKARGKDKEKLLYWTRQKHFDKAEKIQSVIAIYNQLKVAEITKKKADSFFQNGLSKLDELTGNPRKKKMMKEFLTDLMDRNT